MMQFYSGKCSSFAFKETGTKTACFCFHSKYAFSKWFNKWYVGYFVLKLHRYILGKPETYLTYCKKGHNMSPLINVIICTLCLAVLRKIVRIARYKLRIVKYKHRMARYNQNFKKYKHRIARHKLMLNCLHLVILFFSATEWMNDKL